MLVQGVLGFSTFETVPAPMTAFSNGKKRRLTYLNIYIRKCVVIFKFALDIIYPRIFELEVALSEPMARCGRGQNRMRTSESEIETARHYHRNVRVDLVGF